MRTEYEIYMDYERAVSQAKRLQGIASKVNSVADNDVGGTLTSISQNWQGDNADKFLDKGNTLKGKINKSAEDLNRVAEAVIEIAERTRDAELEAIRIAAE